VPVKKLLRVALTIEHGRKMKKNQPYDPFHRLNPGEASITDKPMLIMINLPA
jgi:hypothetical protein